MMRRLLWAWVAVLGAGGAMAAPVVERVEPPSWWVGHTLNPVRLMFRGSGLGGIRLGPVPGMEFGPVTVNARGTCAFVDVRLGGRARPGRRTVPVLGPAGAATATFEILPRQDGRRGGAGFGPDDFIYFLMPDRFANGDPSNDDPDKSRGLHDRSRPRHYHGGDFRGVIQRLPYLHDLGVTALWMTPWYDNHDRLNEREKYGPDNRLDRRNGQPITDYHGYGAVDFYGVEEHFGDLGVLRELVGKAQALGIRVIQDQVANHSGPYHPWVEDPPTPTWLNGDPGRHLENTWQTWTIPDPHATARLQQQTLAGWFVDLLPDLNQDDPECRRYLIQNALWWVGQLGLDGIRQDTLPYVPRTFWRDWSTALKRQHPRLTLLGEMFDGDIAKVSFFQGGRARGDGVDSGIDTLFDFPLFYPVRGVFAEGRPIRLLAEQLAKDHLWQDADRLVTFLGLHDVDRFMNVPGATAEGLAQAFTFLLTTRGIPMIYYGDELGLPGAGDPYNRADFPGGWPGDARHAFEASGRRPAEELVWQRVRTLGRLRREFEPLRRGRLVHLVADDRTYAYARVGRDASAVVVFNQAAEARVIEVPLAGSGVKPAGRWVDALGGPAPRVLGATLQIELPPRRSAVLRPG